MEKGQMSDILKAAVSVGEDKGGIEAVAYVDGLVASANCRERSNKGPEVWDAAEGNISCGEDTFHVPAWGKTGGENEGTIWNRGRVISARIVTVVECEHSGSRDDE